MQRFGVGVAGVVDDQHRIGGAGGADPIVERDQGGARGVGIGAAQHDDITGLKSAEIDEGRREVLGVVLGVTQPGFVAVARVVADHERVACDGAGVASEHADDQERELQRETLSSVKRSVVQPTGKALGSIVVGSNA